MRAATSCAWTSISRDVWGIPEEQQTQKPDNLNWAAERVLFLICLLFIRGAC